MENDARRAILESLKRTSAPFQPTESAELYQSTIEADTSADTLKINLGTGAPLGATMNPLGSPPHIPDDDDLDLDLDLDLGEDIYAEEPEATSRQTSTIPTKPRGITYQSQPFVAPDDPYEAEELPSIYKSSRQSDIEAAAADLESGEEDPSKRMAIKLIVGGIIGLIVFAVVFMAIKGKQKEDIPPASNSSTVTSQPDAKASAPQGVSPAVPDGVIAMRNKEVSFDADIYKDSMEITKVMELRNGNAFCYFMGVPEHFQQTIYIPVSADDYNYFTDGEVLDINYNIATFQGNPYVLNPVLKES